MFPRFLKSYCHGCHARLLNSAGVTIVTTAKNLKGTQDWVNLIIMRKASRQAANFSSRKE